MTRFLNAIRGSERSPQRSSRRHSNGLSFLSLESRTLLATLTIDYSFDTQGFFTDTARRDAIEDVAAEISTTLGDTLDAITPGGINSWSQRFFHPGTGSYASHVTNPTVAADEIIIYAGGRVLGGTTLGQGGPGGFSASGTQAFFDTIRQRGETGVADDTDFAPWGGSVTFSSTTNWHFDESTDGLDFDESDFRSVALHELYHVLGIGTADSWDAQISGLEFTGAASVAEYDGVGNVPLDPGLGHFENGITDNGLPTAMDPSITNGTRKWANNLDYAALTDIGWEVTSPAIGSVTVVGSDLIVDGTNEANLIEVRGSTGDLQILVDGYNHGFFASPTGQLIVNALNGDDEIRLQPLVDVTSTLNGGDGIDLIRGGQGIDHIFGGDGNDMLYGRDGNDQLNGGLGNDRLLGMNGNDVLIGGAGRNTLTGGNHDDEITGGDDVDTIFGSGGNDTIYGGGGNDIISGGTGIDEVHAGAGNDQVSGQSGADLLYGDAGDDVILGGAGDDMIFGGDDNDELRGGGNSDTIDGGAGNDMIYGDQANDFLFGGLGNDQLWGGTSSDELHGGGGNDTLYGGGAVDMLFGDSGEDELFGGTGADILRGGDDNDHLDGEGGADDLFGELGDDVFTGGFALDFFDGGLGIDTALDDGERGEADIEIS